MGAGGGRDLGRLDLGVHAAARQFGFRRARHRLDLGCDGLHDRNQLCVGIAAGRRVIEAVDIGQQDQQIGARHGGDARGEAVIVAVADFVGGDRVVLVDHGHRAPFQQLGDGRARVEIAAALLGVLQASPGSVRRRCRDAPSTSDQIRASAICPTAAAAWLSSSFSVPRGNFSRLRPSAIEPDDTIRTFAAFLVQFGEIGGERRQPRRPHFAGVGIDQQRRADLDDDAAEIF